MADVLGVLKHPYNNSCTFFFPLLCVALLYGTSFSSPPVKVLKKYLWRLFLLFSFSHSVYLDLIYVFLLCMRTNAMFRIVYSIPLYYRAWSDSRCLQWYTPCSPFGTCCLQSIPVYVVKFNEIRFCHFVLYGIVSYDTSSMYCILLRIV